MPTPNSLCYIITAAEVRTCELLSLWLILFQIQKTRLWTWTSSTTTAIWTISTLSYVITEQLHMHKYTRGLVVSQIRSNWPAVVGQEARTDSSARQCGDRCQEEQVSACLCRRRSGPALVLQQGSSAWKCKQFGSITTNLIAVHIIIWFWRYSRCLIAKFLRFKSRENLFYWWLNSSISKSSTINDINRAIYLILL